MAAMNAQTLADADYTGASVGEYDMCGINGAVSKAATFAVVTAQQAAQPGWIQASLYLACFSAHTDSCS
jgi:hypothetical protein